MKAIRWMVALALGAFAFAPMAQAQQKGTIGVSMPTKSSARWIADGDNMVKSLKEKGYAVDLQYAEDDPEEGDWTSAKLCSYSWTAAGQSAVWGLGSSGEGPINVPDTPSDLPAPYNTVSTYVGGTIEWISGKNKGRVVEILGFDEGTQTITLFENMPYKIEVGDMFNIAQGCDGTLDRCKLYDNVINRRAEDYIPGNDAMLAYPDAK